MENLLVFSVSFTLIFIVYLIIYFIRLKKGTLKYSKEFNFLINKYKLDREQLKVKSLGFVIALLNSFIIALTGTVCTMIDYDYIWQILIGFVLLMIFIYIFYEFLGRFLKRKENKKNEHKQSRTKMAKKVGRK